MKNKPQTGFTLIELIIVIVILGILAVTAVPRFIDLSSDAKKANHATLLGAIKSAMRLARMKCMVDAGCNMSGNSSIDVFGRTINMVDGYPGFTDYNTIVSLVDRGDWEYFITTGRAYWWYSGTSLYASDCKIEYRWQGGSGAPSFPEYWPVSNGHNLNTCS
jgi:MSHA pilin protein MshA